MVARDAGQVLRRNIGMDCGIEETNGGRLVAIGGHRDFATV